jgi:asparagine synthase (glutamine-hydrolysing)
VTALAVRSSSNVQTYSIGFPGHGAYDETEHARLVANHFGTKHTELVPEPTGADLLFRLARQFDEPMVDSSMIPTFLVSQLVRQSCTVALGGDGGDELFGGYGYYSRLLWLQKRLGYVPQGLRRLVSIAAEKVLPVGLRGRNWFQGLGENLDSGLPLISGLFDQTTRRRLMASYPGWQTGAEDILSHRIPIHPDLIQRVTRMDFQNYLAEDILVKVDRASMLNSLEVRAPFLDHRVIEFAWTLPLDMKIRSNEGKWLLRKVLDRYIPRSLIDRPKAGFSVPIDSWLRGPLRDWAENLLNAEILKEQGFFVVEPIKTKWREHLDGKRDWSNQLWSVLMFQAWLSEQERN